MEFEIENGVLVKYHGSDEHVVIPEGVTSIGEGAFHCTSLKSITIPNSVITICYHAFSFCTSLRSITIPNSVTSIGEYAFHYCKSLKSIVVDKNNPVYDSRDNCNAIIYTKTNKLILGCKNTVIPNSVITIGDLAFSDCESLKTITIPGSVTSIGRCTFSFCKSLKTITIPGSVTSIGRCTFSFCKSLKSITIPNN